MIVYKVVKKLKKETNGNKYILLYCLDNFDTISRVVEWVAFFDGYFEHIPKHQIKEVVENILGDWFMKYNNETYIGTYLYNLDSVEQKHAIISHNIKKAYNNLKRIDEELQKDCVIVETFKLV